MPPFVHVYSQDMPRLSAAPVGLSPDNLIDNLGRYHRVHAQAGNVQYKRSDFGLPLFEVETDLGPGSEPALLEQERLRVRVFYCRQNTDEPPTWDVWSRYSDDDGETWEDEELMIPGGKHPRPCPHEGAELVAAWVDGEIHATWQEAGDLEPSDPFPLVDSDGNPLAVADDSFGLRVATEPGTGLVWWVLTCVIHGETEPSEWRSSSESDFSFERVT